MLKTLMKIIREVVTRGVIVIMDLLVLPLFCNGKLFLVHHYQDR
jgi:hypothetical protein